MVLAAPGASCPCRYDASVTPSDAVRDAWSRETSQTGPGSRQSAHLGTPVAEPSARARKKADRRLTILESALALIEERGLKGATFELIAARSGVSRGTVFNYFPNKETILVAYFARQLDDLARRAAELRARPTGPGAPEFDGLAEIRYLFAELAGFVQAHRELVLPISFELLDPNEERSRAAYLAIPLVELLRSALKRAQTAGTVRADYSAERLARTLANVFFITALQWAAYRHDRDAREEFAVALRLALEGLVAAG